jgi:hypothetical protein
VTAAAGEVSRRFHDEVIVGNDWDVARQLLAPDLRHIRGAIGLTLHEIDPAGAAALAAYSGAERFIAATQFLRGLFDRWDSVLDLLVADGDTVFTKCTVTGRLGVAFLDARPGTEFQVEQAVVQTVRSGQISTIWALSDQLQLWRDLGVRSVASAAGASARGKSARGKSARGKSARGKSAGTEAAQAEAERE